MNKTNRRDSKEYSFEFNGKTIYYQETSGGPAEQSYIDLNEEQTHFLNYYLGEAEIILQDIFGKEVNLQNFTPEQLDELVTLWLNDSHLMKDVDKETLIYSVGAAFGHHINCLFGTSWIFLTDEFGSDFVCRSPKEEDNPDPVNLTFYPFSSTERAIEDERTDCLNGIIQIVIHNNNWKKEEEQEEEE